MSALAGLAVVLGWLVRTTPPGGDGATVTPPPAETVGSAQAEERPTDATRAFVRRVRVVDQNDRPVAGQVVAWKAGTTLRRRPTDARGIVEVAVLADDAAEGPSRQSTVSVYDGAYERAFALDRSETVVVVRRLPVLDVAVVDGTTGAPVASKGARVTVWVGDEFREFEVVPSQIAGRPRLPLSVDRVVDLRVEVEPPAGYVALQGWTCEAAVAPGASVGRVVVPVFPATSRTVLAVDHAGRPVADARVVSATLLRTERDEMSVTGGFQWMATPDGPGRVVVGRLPAAPGSTLRIDVRAVVVAGDALVGHVDFPADSGDAEVLRVGMRPGLRREPSVRDPETAYVRTTSRRGHRGEPVDATAPLALRVLRRDGAPAVGVQVLFSPPLAWIRRSPGGRTADLSARIADSDGRVLFDEAPRTGVQVQAWGAGFLPTRWSVEVPADGETVLREDARREARVVVVDANGRSLPGVRVTAEALLLTNRIDDFPAAPIPQVRDGVDLLTPRSGDDGAVTLTVPQGSVRYVAALAGLAAVVESDEALVRIVLAPADR